jgi:hypothetical protein
MEFVQEFGFRVPLYFGDGGPGVSDFVTSLA